MLQEAPPVAAIQPHPPVARLWALPVLGPRSRSIPTPVIYGVAIVLTLAYAVFFSWLSLQRYHAFLMHALDMGNMDQAIWNTLHGQLFRFTNMRVELPKEAWGTTTRLSFHVEPILLPLSLLYLIHSGPETLIVAQATIVALGAPAAARLALRLTGSGALAIAAVVAYLLSPALQAATLYEFHPVTLAAPALLWAIVFAEERRYRSFILCAALAVACKEEIGLVVGMLCLWLWWRGGDRRVALCTGAACAVWSVLAIWLIVPHFAEGASAYWQRYIDASADSGRTSTGARGLLLYWLHHPDEPIRTIFAAPKIGMLHRWLVSVGYLGLLGLPTLLISLPSLAILLLSTDQHMYGGLGHYSAELVPIGVAAGIYGVAWLMRLGAHTRLPVRIIPIACAAWLLLMAVGNGRVNGFTPLATGYAAPAITDHIRLGERLLRLIPPGVPVSSMDQLDPHLGDRAESYLFPDVGDAQYIALDITTNVNPGTATELYRQAMALLGSRHWAILAADDGYLILHYVAHPLPATPTIPAAFYRFALLSPPPANLHPLARFGNALELLDVRIERREEVSLRVPDVILITTWRALRPLPPGANMDELLTNIGGKVTNLYDDRLTTAWLPLSSWRPGQIVQVRSRQIAVVSTNPGTVSLRIRPVRKGQSGQILGFTPRLMGDEQYPDLAIFGDSLQVARVRVSF